MLLFCYNVTETDREGEIMVNLFFSSTAEINGRHYRKRLGIDGEDFVSVSLYLDVGKISAPFDAEARREVYNANFRTDISVSYDISRLYKALKNDSELCFWYSSKNADEYLSMLACLAQFGGRCSIYLADCSDLCKSISKLHLEENEHPRPRHQLTEEERSELLAEWERIRAENAPLRIVKDGRIAGLPADYADDAIFTIMGNNAIKTSSLFERFPWKNYPVSEEFLNYRISRLIFEGTVDVVELGWDPYGNYGAPVKIYARKPVIKQA